MAMHRAVRRTRVGGLLAGLGFIVASTGLLPAAAAASRDKAPRPRLRLIWVDPTQAVPFAFEGMARESRRLLGQMDVDATWSRGQAGGPLPGGVFPVVLMPSSGLWNRDDRHVMGAVPRTGLPAPAVWVYFKEVAWAVGLEHRSPEEWSLEDREAFGVALGRVAAHELVHVVLPDRPHSRTGLMTERMHRSVLVRTGMEIDTSTRQAFGAALAQRMDLGVLPGDTPF